MGGLGLTGIIEWVEIQLTPIRSSFIDSVVQRFDSLPSRVRITFGRT
jgi:hypothetical protein